jgi:hypothetical protein
MTNMQGSSSTQPIPHRRWWLWRIAVGYVLFLGCVALLSYRASRVTQQRLDADVRALRAKGQPVLIEDFAEPGIPDEDNAAAYLGRAAKAFEKLSDEDVTDFNDLPNTLPLSPAQMQLMAKLTAKYADSLKDARIARTKAGVNWKMQLRSPVISVLLPWVRPQRHLGQFLRAAALHAHQQGDDATAVEYVRDLLAASRACNRSPFLISHLVAISIAGEAGSTLAKITPDLRIADADKLAPGATGGLPASVLPREDSTGSKLPVAPIPQTPGTRPASRQQVEALLAELLDQRTFSEGFVRNMQGERLFEFDTAICVTNGTLTQNHLYYPPRPGNFRDGLSNLFARTVRPLLLNEARAMLAWSSQMVEAAEQADLPSATAKSPAMPARSLRHPLLSMLAPALNTAANRHYTNLYQLRKVAMGLAGRLYEIDHGALPQRVEELVPGYLPAIPTDPFKGGGAMMPFGPTTQATTQAVGGM